jgi:SAM-dependent methyltransferase
MHREQHEHGTDAAAYWETRYADQGQLWSGRVNVVLADVAAGLEPGRALDLGCGEGGDVLWLASTGWDATGVDLSPTATVRGGAAAVEAGLADRVRFVAADLETWDTDERFDLVTASFLQSWPVEIPRADILRRATRFVAPGGHLLVTAHAAPPGPVAEELLAYRFPTPAEDLRALGLDGGGRAWTVVSAETRARSASRPDGSRHDLSDSVVLVRRAA